MLPILRLVCVLLLVLANLKKTDIYFEGKRLCHFSTFKSIKNPTNPNVAVETETAVCKSCISHMMVASSKPTCA